MSISSLRESCQLWSDRVAVEVESYGAVDVGAVGAGSGGLQALKNVGFGKAERGSVAERDYGVARLYGLENFWRGGGGAAVMSYFQEICARVMQRGDAALDCFFGVTFQ